MRLFILLLPLLALGTGCSSNLSSFDIMESGDFSSQSFAPLKGEIRLEQVNVSFSGGGRALSELYVVSSAAVGGVVAGDPAESGLFTVQPGGKSSR